jgi:hypothetical protein
MGLIKVLPEQKKRKRSRRKDKVDSNPAHESKYKNIYGNGKDIHVIVGGDGIDISERPKEVLEQKSSEIPVVEVELEENPLNEESLNNQETVEEQPLEENKIVVPDSFMEWLANADRSVGFLKAYSSLNVEGTQEVVTWVDNHQDEFMLIWKGKLIPEVEEILYETAMFNYGKYPNVLVKQTDGKIMMKTYNDMLSTDEIYLTEKEIREDWTFLFENGFSKRVVLDEN